MANYIEENPISAFSIESFAILNQLRENGQLCDVSINVGGKTLKAHKNVLSARSPYFMQMFTLPTIEADQKDISIPDVSFETMEQIVSFIYTGKLSVSSETVPHLLKAANLLQMVRLVDLCGNYMLKNIDEANCFATKEVIMTNCDEDIITRANDYINANFEKISENGSFLQLGIDGVVELLSSSEVCCVSEESVLWAALRWLDVSEDRKQFLQRILDCIRLPGISDIFESELTNSNTLNDTIPRAVEFTNTPRTLKTIILAVYQGNAKTAHKYFSSNKIWRSSFRTSRHFCEQLASNDENVFLVSQQYNSPFHYVLRLNFKTYKWESIASIQSEQTSIISSVLCIGQKLYIFSRNDPFSYTSSLLSSSLAFTIKHLGLNYPNSGPLSASSVNSGVLKVSSTNSGAGTSSANSSVLGASSANSVDLGASRSQSGVFGASNVNSGAQGKSSAKSSVQGAFRANFSPRYDLNHTIDIFDMDTNTWSTGPTIKNAREHTKFVSLDKFIYVFKPICRSDPNPREFNTETQKMRKIPPMMTKRHDYGITTYKGKIYVAGGTQFRAETYNKLKSVEVYDPVKNEWRELAPMVTAAYQFTLVATTDGIFALSSPNMQFYNVEKNTWSVEDKLPDELKSQNISACAVPHVHFPF